MADDSLPRTETILISFHDQHRALRLLYDVLADTAEQHALDDAEAAAAHDDEVHVIARREVEDDDGWRARLRERFLLDARRHHRPSSRPRGWRLTGRH